MEKKINKEFKPYISATDSVAEFTLKSILLGATFGIIFGAATVYLALRAGLTVSASIPISVLAISLGRKFLRQPYLKTTLSRLPDRQVSRLQQVLYLHYQGFCFCRLTKQAHL